MMNHMKQDDALVFKAVACLILRLPESGDDELDAMINKANSMNVMATLESSEDTVTHRRVDAQIRQIALDHLRNTITTLADKVRRGEALLVEAQSRQDRLMHALIRVRDHFKPTYPLPVLRVPDQDTEALLDMISDELNRVAS